MSDVLAASLAAPPSRPAVRRLVGDCHRIARACLLTKLRRGRLQLNLLGLSVEDLALDCIAELFKRDAALRFYVLQEYFEAQNWRGAREEELRIALRRLVFSKVNEALFRRYREADPDLARIIRNVKDSARGCPRFALQRYTDGLWLVLRPVDPALRHTPVAPPELLEAHFMATLGAGSHVGEVMAALPGFFEARPQYAPGYPVTGLSRTLRAAFAEMGTLPEDAEEERPFMPFEVELAIRHTARRVRSHMLPAYVDKGKVDPRTYEAYFRAVQDILAAQYLSHAPAAASYFDVLKGYLPHLTPASYRRQHRNRLEYLTKLSRAHLHRSLSE